MIAIETIHAFSVMMVDDHLLLCQGVKETLERFLSNCTVDFYTNVEKARNALEQQDYQFLLCDLLIPGNDVKKFVIDCRSKHPALSIIIISTAININSIRDFFGYGISGYLSKNSSPYELKKAFEIIYNGDQYLSNNVSKILALDLFKVEKKELTKKEIEIIRLVTEGNTVKNIAEILSVSPHTVMTHRRNIMAKLDVHSNAQLVKYAFENKLY